MAGLLPLGTPPPATYAGNTVVNVSPGTGTIQAAVSAHGANTTYNLASGTYTENVIGVNGNHMQFIGTGAPNVLIHASSGLFNVATGVDFLTIWGMTIDLGARNGSAIGGSCSDLLFQNVHVQNYASSAQGFEDFPVYLFATSYSPNNQTIDSCQFTQAASGSVDGTSVIATGAYRPLDTTPQVVSTVASNYTNLTISNNLFDTPTDHGGTYYHCLGSAQQIFGNVFVAPNFSNGMFWYEEAGSWNGNPNGILQNNSSNTSTLTGNTVTLAPTWNFAGCVSHTQGINDQLVIQGNTIHGSSTTGAVIRVIGGQGCPTAGSAITSLNLTNNAIDAGTPLVDNNCANGSPWITSPNNGVMGVPSVTVSAPTNVTGSTATLIGNVTASNGSSISSDGFDWGTSAPAYGNSASASIVQSGVFSANISGLVSGTTYHYRAKATNTSGQGVSGDQSFLAITTPFIQGALVVGGTAGTITTLSLAFSSAQIATNSNVIAISFHSLTATISSVVDSNNNVYQIASPLTTSATDSQAVYWCPSIAGGVNTVTVNLTAASFVSLRIAEFHGFGSVDRHSEATGNGTAASTSVTTTNANDLIVVAANTDGVVSGPAPGFTEPAGMNGNPFGSDLQYDLPAGIGTFTAATPLNVASNWVQNMIAFLPAGAFIPVNATVNIR